MRMDYTALTFLIVLKPFLLRDCSRGQEQSNIPMILCLTRPALLGSRMITFSMALPSYLIIQSVHEESGYGRECVPQTVERFIVVGCCGQSR